MRLINKEGPSNNRRYEVAVYFNEERLASGVGSNTKQAEKAAAEAALNNPIFVSDFQKQQDFAKRAVAAQTHQTRGPHQGKGAVPNGGGHSRSLPTGPASSGREQSRVNPKESTPGAPDRIQYKSRLFGPSGNGPEKARHPR